MFPRHPGRPEFCSQPPTNQGWDNLGGLCRAYIPAWYYSTFQGTCVRFIYGGCGGQDNLFEGEEDGKAKCTQVCELAGSDTKPPDPR